MPCADTPHISIREVSMLATFDNADRLRVQSASRDSSVCQTHFSVTPWNVRARDLERHGCTTNEQERNDKHQRTLRDTSLWKSADVHTVIFVKKLPLRKRMTNRMRGRTCCSSKNVAARCWSTNRCSVAFLSDFPVRQCALDIEMILSGTGPNQPESGCACGDMFNRPSNVVREKIDVQTPLFKRITVVTRAPNHRA